MDATEMTNVAGQRFYTGHRDGPVNDSVFRGVSGVALGRNGVLYVADQPNRCIHAVSGGEVTSIAGRAAESGFSDGVGAEARFAGPAGLAVDSDGHVIVCDTASHRLRKMTVPGYEVSTIAGVSMRTQGRTHLDGSALISCLSPGPTCLDIDSAGDIIFAASYRICKLTAGDHGSHVVALAGTGSSG